MKLSELVKLVEDVVSIPRYYVVGYAKGRLLYVSNEGGFRSLWVLDLSKGVKRRLVEEPIHSVAKLKPGLTTAIYTKDVSEGRELQKVFYVDIVTGEGGLLGEMEPARVIGIAFDGGKVAFSASTAKGAWIYLAKKGSVEKVHDLKGGRAFVTDVQGDTVVGYGNLKGNPKSMELFIFKIGEGTFDTYTPKEGSVNKLPVLNGLKVLFETNRSGRNKLEVLDLNSMELSEASFTYRDYEAYAPVEHVDYGWYGDDKIWAIAKREGRTSLFVDGRRMPLPEGFADAAVVGEGGKFYVSLSSLTSPDKIYEVDFNTGESRIVIDNPLPKGVADALGEVSFLNYKSFDGLTIPTYVIESRKAPKPGPTVIYVHGGPWWEVADYWSPLIASLVAAGFHVVAPNFRGSTGYGEEFRLLDIGDPGGGDLEDVALAARLAKERGLANEVAIAGYSYGGFMTFLATVKKPDLWKCGVAGAGITDWEEMYELSDAYFKFFMEVLFGGRKELFRDRSAVNFAESLRVPLCIIHPQNDSRTPLLPVLKYISKLSKLGKLFEVHILPGIGHMLTKVEDVLKVAVPMISFLRKYMYEEEL